MIYYIAYLSSANYDIKPEELSNLLKISRKNNSAQGITGLLLYVEKDFIQILEGEKEIVIKLYEKILKDTRHKFIIKVSEGFSEKRQFADWSMGFHQLTETEKQNIIGYKNLKKQNILGETELTSNHPAMILIRSFYENLPLYKQLGYN